MPQTCNAGHGCSITCPNGCSALYDHATGRCYTSCSGSAIPSGVELSLDSKIDLCAKDFQIRELAQIFSAFLGKELAVPARMTYSQTNLELKETTVADALKHIGLITL